MHPERGYWSRLASMLAPGGWIYRDAHYLVADMDVDYAAARRWVPWPLRLARPATASLFTAYFPQTAFGSVYREAGLLLHVEHCGARAVFSPWMLVDDDVALILGREVLGYPKKLGAISLELAADGATVSARVERRGAELLTMRGRLCERVADPPPMLGRPHRNVRATLGLGLPRVVAFTPRERPVEVRRAELEVTVRGSERDPLAALGFGRVRAAYLHRVDLGARGVPVPVALASPLWHARNWLLRAH